MDVRLPDGTVLKGVPEGTTKEQILGRLQLAKHPAVPQLMQQMAAKQTAKETSPGGRFAAGTGLAFQNLYRGAKQMVGMGDPNENAATDKELMKTPAGFAGNITGNISALAPLSVIPGANTTLGAGALGATVGALQPTESSGERLGNMATGGFLGGLTQFLGGTGAKMIGERAAAKEAALKAQQSQNAVRDETIRLGRDAGFVVPPSAINRPSFLGGRMESLAGKAALGQESSIRNQAAVDALARQEAGLGANEAISAEALRNVRRRAAEPYRQIASIDDVAARHLEAAQTARVESKLQWKHYGRTADPAAHRAAVAADNQAKMALDAIDEAATRAGKPELIQQLKQARQLIAKNHQVQEALNRGTGSVDPAVLGRALDRGVPLSGGLETIARYQQAFPQFMREASRVPAPQVGKTELLAAALLGGGGMAAGGPMGAVAGLAPFASGPTRSALLSKPVQQHLATPNYSVGAFTRGATALADPETRRRTALLARSLALPAIPQAVND